MQFPGKYDVSIKSEGMVAFCVCVWFMRVAGVFAFVVCYLWFKWHREKLVPLCVADLYRLVGDTVNEAEGYRMHTTFSQSLLKDHFQSSQLQEHGLIQVSFLARFCIERVVK